MKNIIVLFSLLVSTSLFAQELFWYDVQLEVASGSNNAVKQLVVDYYSSIDIPENVSASFSAIPLRGENFRGTHILSFVSPSSQALADFRSSLSGPKWEAYLAKMQDHVISNRALAGNGLVVVNPTVQDPIGQVWLFKMRDKNANAFVSSFGELMQTFNFEGFAVAGQVTHGNSNSENMFIYASYKDLNAALSFGPKTDKEQAAFGQFFENVDFAEFTQSFTRVLIKQF